VLSLREEEHDLRVRLSRDDRRRAPADPSIRAHRRFARRGWVELNVERPADLPRAGRRLRRAHAVARHLTGEDRDG
jgi:hypothetical protein